MKYLGYKKTELKKEENGDSPKYFLEVFIFNNPGLVNYDTGFIGVQKIKDYKHWIKIENDFFKEQQDKTLHGIGIHKDNLFDLSKENLSEISEKINISEKELEKMSSWF